MRSISTILFSIICFSALAQEGPVPPTGNVATAKTYITEGSYGLALAELKLAIRKDPEDIKINQMIAECYLNTNEDKPKAIAHLEKVVKSGKYDAIDLYDLGKAYAYNEEIDKAIEYFNRYKKEGKLKPDELEDVDHEIEKAQTAKELMKIPLNITFTNLGKDVNTEFFEGHPFTNENESAIYFTTKRKGTTGGGTGDEGFVSDVYQIELKPGDKWSKAKNVGASVNTFSLEEITSLSSNGSYLVFTMIDEIGAQRIKYCEKLGKAKSFGKAIDFGELINDVSSIENAQTSGCISNDGQTCIFSSNRKGGFGGFDLYISIRRPNGTWGEPLNLGSKINTKYDETYPNFGANNNTLYFASAGHTNMGGFDIFKTVFSSESHAFSNPVNLGYPINTTDNDYCISFNKTGRNAYVGRRKTGGFGNLDIYQLTFKNVGPPYTVVALNLKAHANYQLQMHNADSLIELHNAYLNDPAASKIPADSSKSIIARMKNLKASLDPVTGSMITVTNTANNKTYGEYSPNLKTGRAIMILEPGVYEITVSNDKYKVSKTKVTILDKANFVQETKVDVIMHKGELETAK
jgi:hypothetical protein